VPLLQAVPASVYGDQLPQRDDSNSRLGNKIKSEVEVEVEVADLPSDAVNMADAAIAEDADVVGGNNTDASVVTLMVPVASPIDLATAEANDNQQV
jgi:hypothetical protein